MRKSWPQELGIPATDVQVEEGDTDTAPYGLGTYASRSTPTAGAATAMAARKIREKAKKIAAHLLEASEEDLEWEPGKFSVKGAPSKAKTIQEIAFAAYTKHPPGMEAGLGSGRLLRSAEPDFPLRHVHLPWSISTRERARSKCGDSWRWTIAATSSIR